MLRSGKLDVSPSSSIEYLRHKNKYSIMPWFSVSSAGPVGSIFLFSKLPIEDLDKRTIAVSSDSETSAALLKIILKDFFSLTCKFKKINNDLIKQILASYPACLLIGDNAMRAKKQLTVNGQRSIRLSPPHPPLTKGGQEGHGGIYIYDLGELWFKHTGLPFVFALWIVRKKSLLQKKELIKKLSQDLNDAKKCAFQKLSLMASHAPQQKWLSTKELVAYWKGISYDFTDKHLEGLKLFEEYAFKNKFKT